MTSTRPGDELADPDRAQTILDWTRINSRLLTGAAVVIALAAGGYWFYGRSRQIQAAKAEQALLSAKQSMGAGNLPLAQSDLQSVRSRYGSTTAGVEAALLLAQIAYDQGKPQDGVNMLKETMGHRAAAPMESTIRSLIGDGYAQMGKLREAGKEYESAASATDLPNERVAQRAKAARAYAAGGDTASGRRIWSELVDDPKAQMISSEARVRLGELSAQVAKK